MLGESIEKAIGYVHVTVCHCSPVSWCKTFHMKMNLIFKKGGNTYSYERFCTKTRFDTEPKLNSVACNNGSFDVKYIWNNLFIFELGLLIKVRNDHRSKFSNLSNWKDEA